MNKITMKCIVTLFSIMLLLSVNPCFATDKEKAITPETQSQSTQEVQSTVNSKTDENAAEHRKKILSEATVAISESRKALKALDEGKTEEAIKALELATGKIALIIARDPELALAKIDVNVKVFDVFANVKTLKETVKQAIKYLKNGKVQLARPLVDSLVSEIVIESINIPLATYPDAIIAVVPLIDKGKTKDGTSGTGFFDKILEQVSNIFK